jgi:hydrophobic/amphiphilic exporter-1 (mainly G- bacteria), HAE1 family
VRLSDTAIRRPAFTTMITLTLMVVGIVGYARLPVDFFPDVSLPIFTVIVPYPGANPDQIEREVAEPLEEALSSIGGLEETRSFCRENVAIVVTRFSMESDATEVGNEIRDRVSAVRSLLPDDIRDPIFRKLDPAAMPIMTWAVSSAQGPLATRELADRLVKPAVERVPGVGSVEVSGGREREIRIELDLPKMAALRIPLMRVIQLIGYDTRDIPAGVVELGDRRMGLRSSGQVDSLEELGGIVVQPLPSPVYLRDIATLVDGEADRSTTTRVDGIEAVTFAVIKESGSNTMAIVRDVRKAMKRLEELLPEGTTVEPVIDLSDMVGHMNTEMRTSLMLGALFAILVIYLFMADWRATLITAIALPTSVVTTFFFMYLAGFSLNILSLLGLSLAVGILVDDAVVVIEVIHRHREAGASPFEAASKGTSEVGLAVLAATLTIMAVFVPVGFVGGMIGQFFKEFGLSIALAVAVSLFIAFTVTPMLTARVRPPLPIEQRGRITRFQLGVMQRIDDGYRALLAVALRHGRLVVAVAMAMFVSSLLLVGVVGFEFIPKYDRGRFEVDVRMAPSTSLAAAEEQAGEIEALLQRIDAVEHIYTVVGPDGETDRLWLSVGVGEKGTRPPISALQEEARTLLGELPGLSIAVADPPIIEGGPVSKTIEIQIRGDDSAAIARVADQVRTELRQIPGTIDVVTTHRPGRPELQLEVDRDKAAVAGLSVGQVGIALRMAIAGVVVGTYREDQRSYDIRVRARAADREPRAIMGNLLLLSPLPRLEDPYGLGTPVALGNVARVEHRSAPLAIERHDKQRHLQVACNLAGRPLSDVKTDILAMFERLDRPPEVEVVLLGESDAANDALGSLLWALGLAIFFIYAVLVSQFESFVHPFTIMLSLPLAVVGAFVTLLLAGWQVGIVSMLGVILLMGLVTKNAILLVDRANQLREQGRGIVPALLEAGHLRLRPILMTTLATILGMLPPALSTGAGSEIRRPMAWPVIGGMLVSTLLTLVVVPVVYMWIEGYRERFQARRKARAERRARRGEAEETT